jgi:hypothetical protein
MIHELKCWKEPFRDIKLAGKRFEFRKNDRNFQVNDFLFLREYDNFFNTYTNDYIICKVILIYRKGFGIPENYCIMQINILNCLQVYNNE